MQSSVDKNELRCFGLILGAVLGVVFGLALPWFADKTFPWWPWMAAGIVWMPAVLVPRWLYPVFRVWMAIAHLINAVVTRLVLGIIYYVVLLPTGLLARMFGRDPLARKWVNRAPSYRTASSSLPRNHMERPF